MVLVVHMGKQLLGERQDFFQRMEWGTGTGASGDLGKVVEFDFQGEGVATEAFPFQAFAQFASYMV